MELCTGRTRAVLQQDLQGFGIFILRTFHFILFFIYIFSPSLHHLQPKMSAVWINAIWILSFALLDVAFSNYSEDQCSWRGRQVIPPQSYNPCVDPNETLVPKTREAAGATLGVFCYFQSVYALARGQCVRDCNLLRLAIWAQSKCLRCFAAIAPAGCLQETWGVQTDRRLGGLALKAGGKKKIGIWCACIVLKLNFFILRVLMQLTDDRSLQKLSSGG